VWLPSFCKHFCFFFGQQQHSTQSTFKSRLAAEKYGVLEGAEAVAEVATTAAKYAAIHNPELSLKT